MRIFKEKFYLFLLLFSLAQCPRAGATSSQTISKNTWIPRAFSSYGVHDLIVSERVGYEDSDCERSNVILSLFTEYMQNFSHKCSNDCHSLGAMPFWSGTNTMTYGNNGGEADLDAYQFGLGNIITNDDGIGGTIQLNPFVQHMGSDGVLYFAHEKDDNGVFFKVHIPFGAMIIHPHFTEVPLAQPNGKVGFTQTTLDPNSSIITYDFTDYPTPYDRPQSLTEAFFGGSPEMDRLRGNRPHPIRLRRARVESCKQTKIRFGDVSASIGYNRFFDESFISIGAKFSFPTGNVPTSDHMLEPIFGRAGLWGVGAEFSGLYKFWDNEDNHLNLVVQAEALHLMSGIRPNFRTFDLKQNGPGSKYLLVANYRSRYTQTRKSSGALTSVVLDAFGVQPLANISTFPVHVKNNVEGLVSVMLDFGHNDSRSNDWNFAIGAEFWGRSAEKLSIDVPMAIDLRLPNLNDYAVLGRQVSSYLIDGQEGPYFTYYCEPLARINKSQDPVRLVGSVLVPPGVFALATQPSGGPTDESLLPEGIKDARLSENRIPEKLIDALDICGASAPSAISGKLFVQIGHSWTESDYRPTLSVVSGVELTHYGNVHVNMWSIGLQGSLNI